MGVDNREGNTSLTRNPFGVTDVIHPPSGRIPESPPKQYFPTTTHTIPSPEVSPRDPLEVAQRHLAWKAREISPGGKKGQNCGDTVTIFGSNGESQNYTVFSVIGRESPDTNPREDVFVARGGRYACNALDPDSDHNSDNVVYQVSGVGRMRDDSKNFREVKIKSKLKVIKRKEGERDISKGFNENDSEHIEIAVNLMEALRKAQELMRQKMTPEEEKQERRVVLLADGSSTVMGKSELPFKDTSTPSPYILGF